MRKDSVRGVTLIELIIAVAISGGVLMMAGSYVFDSTRTALNYRRLSLLQKDLPIIRKLTNLYFDRGTAARFTQFGAAVAGYQIFEQGVIVIDADLRPCTTFSPSTSAANLTRVVISCCNEDLSFAAMTPTGETMTFTSACTTGSGLSYEEFVNNISKSKQCISDLEQMNVALVGSDDVRRSPLYSLDFFANTGRFKDNTPNPLFNLRTILYESLGNAGGLTLECQPPSLPY